MTRRFDSPKLRDSARGQTCTLQVVGVCSFDPATVVLCHAPSEFKGAGIKSPDFWAAFGCSRCHDVLDHRAWMPGKALIEDDEARFYWLRGICRTQAYWFGEGLLRVA